MPDFIVTQSQMDIMKHALGLNYKHRPYRNRFFTLDTDPEWNDLVKKGLAVKGPAQPGNENHLYFWLTKPGVEFVLGKEISDAFYNDL